MYVTILGALHFRLPQSALLVRAASAHRALLVFHHIPDTESKRHQRGQESPDTGQPSSVYGGHLNKLERGRHLHVVPEYRKTVLFLHRRRDAGLILSLFKS